MQAALMLRSKSKERRKIRLAKAGLKHELPSNVATKSIAPFPRYPPTTWCAQGRAAWQEAAALASGAGVAGAGGAARRCSVLGDHPRARSDRKWPRNNRVRDASYGSSSESECESEAGGGGAGGAGGGGAARLLYAGLGTLAIGLLVYFVGTGDKGFKTQALRLVGPSLIVGGLACCVLRVLLCVFAKPCCRRHYKENRRLSRDGCGEELPLADRAALLAGRVGGAGSGAGGGAGASGMAERAGPAQCSPARRRPDASSCDVSSISSAEEDERLRRYRTAHRPPPPPPLPPPPPPPAHAPHAPRGVSFARGELVLSPAQLRS